eukprot:403346987
MFQGLTRLLAIRLTDFSDIRSQMRNREKEKHSSESKSSDDDRGTFFFAKVWFFHVNATDPWSHSLIRISPSLITKGYKTIITHKRFRAYLIGGNNSRQNYEFILERKVFKERAQMKHKRAYYAHSIKNDKYIYVIGGRGDSELTQFSQFTYSQFTMERFDIEENKWHELSAILEDGRYHASACILKDRYIYVFGGYKTELFYSKVAYKVTRKHEKLQSVRPDYIEVYDTENDEFYNPLLKKERPYFIQININRNHLNNVGNLICFPLQKNYNNYVNQDSPNPYHVEDSNEILITGGLFIGIIDVKAHVYNIETNRVNQRKDLSMPFPDISKFYYHTPQNKVYVVGRYRIQEFDLEKVEWRQCGLGFVQFCEQSWSF